MHSNNNDNDYNSPNHSSHDPRSSAVDALPSPTMPHREDPHVMSPDDRASRNEIGTQDTPVPESLAERMASASITDSSPTSHRPEVSRSDTDSYQDYPSTEPAASSAAKVAEPSGHDELEASPYADEHALNRGAYSSSETSGVPLPSTGTNDYSSSSAAAGLPRYTADKTSHSPTTHGAEDPAFLVRRVEPSEHAFLDSSSSSPTPQSAPAAVHPVADPLEKEGATAATHETGKKGESILGKVASMLGSGKSAAEKEERRTQGKKGKEEEGEEEEEEDVEGRKSLVGGDRES